MGGLVGRAALKINGPGIRKVDRILMLVLQNFGSFMPALALCMQDSLINRVISLDETQSNTALIKKVFSSFPSWYQMLPSHSAGHFEEYDLFESENWPKKIPTTLTSDCWKPVEGSRKGCRSKMLDLE